MCHRVQLGVYLRAYSGVCLRASCEHTWERTVKQAGSVPSSAIGSVLESMPGGVHGSVLGVYLGASCERTWEGIVKQAWSVSSSAIGNLLESVLGSVLESVLKANLRTYSQAGWECAIECNPECTSERTWKHALKSIWQLAFNFVLCSVM